MNLRLITPKFYLDRTELPILNDFPLGYFLATIYVVALPKLWQQVAVNMQTAVPDSVSWSASQWSNQSAVSDPVFWSAGAGIKSALSGVLWSTSAVHDAATAIPVCGDHFSKEVVGKLAQADDILAGILTDQEPLLALPIVVATMKTGLSSLTFLQRLYAEDGIEKYDRESPPSPLDLLLKTQKDLLNKAHEEIKRFPYHHARLANVTLSQYHLNLADLKQLETFSQKRSGYVKLRSFLSSEYAAHSKHSQYYESRALEIVHYHVRYIAPFVAATLNVSKSLHNLFEDIARFPERLQEAVDQTPSASHIPEATNTDNQARMTTLLKDFNNSQTVNEWLIKKTGGVDWVANTKEVFSNGNNAYGSKMEKLGELYKDLIQKVDDEMKKKGWFSRFRNARSGVVGCAGVLEKQVEGLEEAYKKWGERRREWSAFLVHRNRLGIGMDRETMLKMLKGIKGGE